MANLQATDNMPEEPTLIAKADDGQGAIRISEDVIAAIVRHYTLDVPGVVRLAGQSLVGGLANMLGKRMHDRSIMVEMSQDHINVTVTIVVRFGEHVPSVALNVQNVCRKRIEELTGQRIGKINVFVYNLDSEDGEDEEKEQEY